MARKLYTILIVIVLFSLSAFASIPFWEFPAYDNPIRLQMYMSEFDLFSGYFLLQCKERLNLTEKQIQKIEGLMLDYQEYSIQQNADIKIQELRITAAIKAKTSNRQEIESSLKNIGKMKGDSMVRYINYLLDLRDILTPVQLDKMKKIRDAMKAKFEKERKKRHPHSPPRPDKKEANNPFPPEPFDVY